MLAASGDLRVHDDIVDVMVVGAGRMTNILPDVSPTRIELREFRRRHDATLMNDFIAEDGGMRVTLTSVFPRWPYRLAEPLLKPLVLRRMRRYVVEPLKRAAEDRLCRLDQHL